MKPVTVIVLAIVCALAGCRASQPTGAPQIEVVRISSLPSLGAFPHKDRILLSVLFCVVQDGTVADVRIMGTSGDAKWDAAAVDSMRQWRFGAITSGCPPEGLWVRQTVVAQAEERIVMSLGELTVAGQHEADSLYTLLNTGVEFESLVAHAAAASGVSGTILGPTDIARYPRRVRDELRTLSIHEVTHPIRLGVNYVIYKRLDHEVPPPVGD